jgi:hypothetical protein
MIEFERAQEDLEEKRKIASRRSGARHVLQLIHGISYDIATQGKGSEKGRAKGGGQARGSRKEVSLLRTTQI